VVRLNEAKDKLTPNSRLVLETLLTQKGALDDVKAFLQVLADIVDLAASGHDAYATIGANRERSSLLLTVRVDGRAAWVSGLDLVEVMAGAESLL